MFVRTAVLMQGPSPTQTRLGLSLGALTLVIALAVSSASCLPDPHRVQAQELFDRLGQARLAFTNPNTFEDACNAVGEVQTRLVGEPGLAEGGPGYPALRDAAAALQAVCGQGTLVREATAQTDASAAARARWTTGMQRELDLACEYLRAAAGDLGRQAPC